jgi:hypothetical protein
VTQIVVPAGNQDVIKEQVGKLKEILKKANKGDSKALAELEKALDQFPALVPALGNVAQHVEHAIREWFGPVSSEACRRHLANMRRELGYDNTSELERLLIDRVCITWLRVQQAEMIKTSKEKEGMTADWALIWDKRLAIANRNFLAACRALAQVRKLTLNIGQVNITAGQQVNVANLKRSDDQTT